MNIQDTEASRQAEKLPGVPVGRSVGYDSIPLPATYSRSAPAATPRATPKHDPDQTLAFLSQIMIPGACHEFCALRAHLHRGYLKRSEYGSKTYASWYNNIHSLVADAMRLDGISGYIVPNPITLDLLSRSDNSITSTRHRTTDSNVLVLRWALVDIDSERPEDISATDAELAAALERRDAILAAYPDLAAASLWGCSGNGGWILVRLADLPNDEVHNLLVADALASLAERFNDDIAHVDIKTKNAARLMALPGTIKAKGSNRPERPWRLATWDSPPVPEGVTFDLAAWVAENPPSKPAARPAAKVPTSVPTSKVDTWGTHETRYAVSALEREVSAVATAPAGSRNNTLNRAALAMGEFIASEAIDRGSVETALAVAARSAGLGDSEIAKTIASGLEAGLMRPRDLSHVGSKARREGMEEIDGLPIGAEGDEKVEPDEFAHVEAPQAMARRFVNENHAHPDGKTIRYWRDGFHIWENRLYNPTPSNEIKAQVSLFCQGEFEKEHAAKLIRYGVKRGRAAGQDGGASDDSKGPPKLRPLTTRFVGDVIQATSGLALVESSRCPAQPAWLDGEDGPQATQVIPMRNAIVDLPAYLAGRPCVRRPTPLFFAPYSLKYDWNAEAPEPTTWLEFLGAKPLTENSYVKYQLWPGPTERDHIDMLQEWMGLQLVPDTRYQKIMAMIGPPRSGKGTIARVMQAMVGKENCAGPTLASFGMNFGLTSLIGKLSAIIDDARLSSKSDVAVIAERLLTISGEGHMTIDRKFSSAWEGTLSTRITLLSNELPRIGDSSGALANRFIVLPFTQSFLGREDLGLEDKLKAELPGILLWSIEGLRRLRERGRFLQPEDGAELQAEMEDLGSPIGTFVRERCIVDPEEQATKADLYSAWKEWCEDNSRREIGDRATFGRNLRSVVPGLKDERPRQAGKRLQILRGIGLIPPESLLESSTASDAEEEKIPF